MTDHRAFNIGLAWFVFAFIVLWFNPHHAMFVVAMVSSSVWFAANWLAERLSTPDRSGEADKTENTGLAEGESGLPEGWSKDSL